MAIGSAITTDDPYPLQRQVFAGGVESLPNVVYASVPGFRRQTLDLYLPPGVKKGETGHPLVVFVHGGGWQTGHPRQLGAFKDFPAVLAHLSARGFVVAAISYRLSGEAPFPAAEHDIRAAVRWLRANAASYGIDPARVALWGTSAGGHLAGLVAARCGQPSGPGHQPTDDPDTDCVQAAVLWYGLFDLNEVASPAGGTGAPSPQSALVEALLTPFLGCRPADCSTDLLRQASPLAGLHAGAPPMLLIHGDADTLVSPRQSQLFQNAARALGVPADLLLLPGVDHAFIGTTLEATRAASMTALNQSIEFMVKALGPP